MITGKLCSVICDPFLTSNTALNILIGVNGQLRDLNSSLKILVSVNCPFQLLGVLTVLYFGVSSGKMQLWLPWLFLEEVLRDENFLPCGCFLYFVLKVCVDTAN